MKSHTNEIQKKVCHRRRKVTPPHSPSKKKDGILNECNLITSFGLSDLKTCKKYHKENLKGKKGGASPSSLIFCNNYKGIRTLKFQGELRFKIVDAAKIGSDEIQLSLVPHPCGDIVLNLNLHKPFQAARDDGENVSLIF